MIGVIVAGMALGLPQRVQAVPLMSAASAITATTEKKKREAQARDIFALLCRGACRDLGESALAPMKR